MHRSTLVSCRQVSGHIEDLRRVDVVLVLVAIPAVVERFAEAKRGGRRGRGDPRVRPRAAALSALTAARAGPPPTLGNLLCAARRRRCEVNGSGRSGRAGAGAHQGRLRDARAASARLPAAARDRSDVERAATSLGPRRHLLGATSQVPTSRGRLRLLREGGTPPSGAVKGHSQRWLAQSPPESRALAAVWLCCHPTRK